MGISISGDAGKNPYNPVRNTNEFGMAYNRGSVALACETSIHRNKIDQWLNETKSFRWISGELEKLGEKISEKSIAKYKSYRDQYLQKELAQMPEYNAKMQMINENITDGIGKIQQIDIMQHLADTIEHCADMLVDAKDREIAIKNVQDMRWIQQSLFDALKLYGEMALMAQKFKKVEENPDILKPTVSVDVKNLLADMLGGMDDTTRFKLIDRLRGGSQQNDSGGIFIDPEPE